MRQCHAVGMLFSTVRSERAMDDAKERDRLQELLIQSAKRLEPVRTFSLSARKRSKAQSPGNVWVYQENRDGVLEGPKHCPKTPWRICGMLGKLQSTKESA